MFSEFKNPESVDYDIKTAVNKEPVTIKDTVSQREKYASEIIDLIGFLEDGEWVNYGITEDEYFNPTIEVVNKIKNQLNKNNKILNRNSERSYTKEEIMQDPKYFAQRFSEENKNLEELLLFCYTNGISTLACCAGHEDSNDLVPHTNIVFNVQPEHHKMFALLMEVMLKSGLSNYIEISLRNPTGNQVLLDIGLNNLKYRNDFFKSIKALIGSGLYYSGESVYNQLLEIYFILSSKNIDENSVDIELKEKNIILQTLGIEYVEDIDEMAIVAKEISPQKEHLISYLESLENIKDIDLNNIKNSYQLDESDIVDIHQMNFMKNNINVK